MFNLVSDSVYRNCLDSKRGDCPYAEYRKYPVMNCVFDRNKVADDSMGCVPSETKRHHLKRMLSEFIPDCLGVAHVPKPKFNLVFYSGGVWPKPSGRRYRVYEELSINEDRLDMELRKIDLQTMADR